MCMQETSLMVLSETGINYDIHNILINEIITQIQT